MTEPVAASSTRPARPGRLRRLSIAFVLAIVALLAVAISSASAAVTEVNLAVDVLNRMRELGRPGYVRSI